MLIDIYYYICIMGRKADTNFLEKLNIRNGKFKLVSEYVNQKTDIIVSDELGIEYKTKPNDLQLLPEESQRTLVVGWILK